MNIAYKKLDPIFYINPTCMVNLCLQECGIEKFQENFFKHFSELKTVNLKGNLVKHLADDLFITSSQIESLNLSNNRIRSINTQSLQNLLYLKELILSHNEIEELDSSFLALDSLKSFDCSSNQIRFVSPTAFLFLPNLVCLKMGNNRIAYLDRLIFYPCSQLKHLSIHTNFIEFFPNISFLTNLKTFHFSRNELYEIRKKNLSQNLHLQFLDLSRNMIEKIPKQLLKNLKELKTLKLTLFDEFELKKISKLENLQTLHLDLPSEHLHLHDTDILELMKHYKYLKNLTIIGATFQFEHCLILKNMKNLQYLHFEGYNQTIKFNSLRKVGISLTRQFSDLPNLKTIILKRTYLFITKTNTFSRLKPCHFENLDLTGLQNNSLVSCFHGFEQLKHLNLSHTSLKKIKNYLFFRLVNLVYLNLEGTNLHYILRQQFAFNIKLEQLNLENCSIDTIENYSFVKLKALKLLNLKQNSVRYKINVLTLEGLQPSCEIIL